MDIELDSATALGSIWDGLCISWNCFNPSLLGHVIEGLDDETLKTDMENYKKKLKRFKTKTQLNDTVKVTFQKSSEETFTPLAVNLNEAWDERTLEDLETLATKITEKFHLPKFLMLLQRITRTNYIHVTWAIPAVLGSAAKARIATTNIDAFCTSNEIISIAVDDVAKSCPAPMKLKPMEKKETPKCSKPVLLKDRQFMDTNPCMKTAMLTPVVKDIIEEVFEWRRDTNTSFPTTMTQLYSAFTCKLLTQHCKKETIISLEEIPADMKKRLRELSTLAWEGTADKRLAFNSKAINGDTLGLMYSVRRGSQLIYHFIHPTLQDFLSAYHISRHLLPDIQESIIRANHKTDHWNMAVKFYFGLTQPNRFTSRMIAERIGDLNDATPYHWLFEVADVKKLTEVLGLDRTYMVQPSHSWKALDYYVLGCAAAVCPFKWHFDFRKVCISGDKCVRALCKGMADKEVVSWPGKIAADFEGNNITLDGVRCLAHIPLQMAQQICFLDFSKNRLDMRALKAFCEVVPKLENLQLLSLWENPIGRGGAVEVLKCLSHHKTPLKALDLSDTYIGEEDCEQLAAVIASSPIESLDISLNNLSSSSVAYVMSGLLQNNTIKELDIDNSHFSEENCRSVAQYVPQATSLRELRMNNCDIDREGLVHLARALDNRHGPISWGFPCDLMKPVSLLRRTL